MVQDPVIQVQTERATNEKCCQLKNDLKNARESLKKKEDSVNAHFQKGGDPTLVDGVSKLILADRNTINDLEAQIKKHGCEGSASVNLSDPQFIIGSSVPRRKSPSEISPA